MTYLQHAETFIEKMSANRTSAEAANYVWDQVVDAVNRYNISAVSTENKDFAWDTSYMGYMAPGIFALAGPSAERVGHFFFDILNLGNQPYPKINYIVSLGNNDSKDFINYFDLVSPHQFIAVDSQNKNFNITISSTPPEKVGLANKYTLDIHYAYAAPQQVAVIHLNTPDMQPLNWDVDTMQAMSQLLLPALQENRGIAVHCKAGLGRTGHFVSWWLLCLTGYLEKIFENDDEAIIFKRLAEFLIGMRAARPHFIMTPMQYWASITDAVCYLTLKANLQNKIANASDSQIIPRSYSAMTLFTSQQLQAWYDESDEELSDLRMHT